MRGEWDEEADGGVKFDFFYNVCYTSICRVQKSTNQIFILNFSPYEYAYRAAIILWIIWLDNTLNNSRIFPW